MSDDRGLKAGLLIPEEDERLSDAMERDARRYDKAFDEEEEASLR